MKLSETTEAGKKDIKVESNINSKREKNIYSSRINMYTDAASFNIHTDTMWTHCKKSFKNADGCTWNKSTNITTEAL